MLLQEIVLPTPPFGPQSGDYMDYILSPLFKAMRHGCLDEKHRLDAYTWVQNLMQLAYQEPAKDWTVMHAGTTTSQLRALGSMTRTTHGAHAYPHCRPDNILINATIIHSGTGKRCRIVYCLPPNPVNLFKKEWKKLQKDMPPQQPSSCRYVIAAGRCSACGKEGPLRNCARCRAVSYCSEECQRAQWPLHKADCKMVVQGGEK